MAKYTTTGMTTSIAFLIAKVKKPRAADAWYADIHISGTFDGATVTIQASPDGGTTKINKPDVSGLPIILTAAGLASIICGCPNKNADNQHIYATVSGAGASTNLVATVFDNEG